MSYLGQAASATSVGDSELVVTEIERNRLPLSGKERGALAALDVRRIRQHWPDPRLRRVTVVFERPRRFGPIVFGRSDTALVFNVSSAAQPESESFNVLLKDDGHTWCAYENQDEFKADAAALKPTENVRITYQASAITELTHQVGAESGDWIVIDTYTPSNGDLLLKRANRMVQPNLQITQEAAIHDGKAGAFRVVDVTTLDGKKAELSNVDFPPVPQITDLVVQPFVRVVTEMRTRAVAKLCK
jgi:hypothetical protein